MTDPTPPSPWTSVDPTGRLLTAQYRFPGGVSRTTIVTLAENSFLVYSPGAGLEQTPPPGMDNDSTVLLLGPTVSHTLGLAPWKEAFPNARIIASPVAAERLARKAFANSKRSPSTGSVNIEALEVAGDVLPDEVTLHLFEASKMGEVWVRFEGPETVYWIVCDGFTNLEQLPRNPFIKSLMFLYGLRAGLKVTPVYRFNIKDKSGYRDWVIERFSAPKAHVLIPCHGAVDGGSDLGPRVVELMQKRF